MFVPYFLFGITSCFESVLILGCFRWFRVIFLLTVVLPMTVLVGNILPQMYVKNMDSISEEFMSRYISAHLLAYSVGCLNGLIFGFYTGIITFKRCYSLDCLRWCRKRARKRFVQIYCTLVTDEQVLDFIARLVHLEGDKSIEDTADRARGLRSNEIRIRRIFHLHSKAWFTWYDSLPVKNIIKYMYKIPPELKYKSAATKTVRPAAAFNTGKKQWLDETELQRQSCVLNDTEMFLFHATTAPQMLRMAECGLRTTNSAHHGYINPTIQLSELAQTADKLAETETTWITTELSMFVFRVGSGQTDIFKDKLDAQRHSTKLGRLKRRLCKFMFPNQPQLLPEFLIEYERIDKADSQI